MDDVFKFSKKEIWAILSLCLAILIFNIMNLVVLNREKQPVTIEIYQGVDSEAKLKVENRHWTTTSVELDSAKEKEYVSKEKKGITSQRKAVPISEPTIKSSQKFTKKGQSDYDDFTLDINSASQEEWKKIRGIGDYYSKRIMRFREALGGFVSIDQVAQTYHLPDSVFQKIRPKLKMETKHKVFDPDTMTIQQLKAHPYIKESDAYILKKVFMEKKDRSQIVEELNEKIQTFEQLLPYLAF